MLIQNVRLSFPNLFRAGQFNEDATPKYSAMLIVPKDHPQKNEINAAIMNVIGEKWGDKKPSSLKICVRDGDEKADKDGFGPDVVFFNATNTTRPTVVDRDRTPLTESDGRPYAGCYVDSIVEFWAQDNKYGKRINASLSGIQFRADGDAFGGGRPAGANAFEDLSEVTAEDEDTADFMS